MSPRVVVVTTSFPRHDDDPSGHFVRAHALHLARGAASVETASPSSDRMTSIGTASHGGDRASSVGTASHGGDRASSVGTAFHGGDRASSVGTASLSCGRAEVHVLAPFGSASDPVLVRGPLHIHPSGGSLLFGFPGAAARFAENPLRLAGAAAFAEGVRRRLRELAPIDRVVAHWIVPGAWPLLAGVDAPLDVVSHGADVRLLVRLPEALRCAILRSLLDRGARFQFVAAHLLGTLASSLPGDLAGRLRGSSFVEPAPLELPDVGRAAERVRASLEMKAGEPLAVCVGRLVREKRYNLALAGVARLEPRVRLAIIGDGPERPRLEALAAQSGVLATSTGALPRPEALAWIAAADVLVHPSAHEGAPTVVREARALGTRVVACAAGDLERWAQTDAGIAIVAPDPRAIGDAVLRATSGRASPASRARC